MVILALCGGFSAVMLNSRNKACIGVAFGAAAAFSACGIMVAIEVLVEGPLMLSLPITSVIGQLSFGFNIVVDQLSAFFLLVICTLALPVSIYSVGYVKEYEGHYGLGRFGLLFNLFLLSMVLVVTAGNIIVFLIAWELMSLCSYFLVTFESRDTEKASAGLLYLVMTHIGSALIMLALLLLAFQANSFEFSDLKNIGLFMGVDVRSIAFILLLLGFGTKAGIVPLHVWLPKAHPAAPSNISALMSGVMIKTAIYMLIRTYFDFLGINGPGDAWLGLLFLLIASISALIGVLYALVEKDIKRILAFSSIENVGIILIAFGAAMVFKAYGLNELAALALIATLLHVFFHSLFKGLLFLGAGSILHATGTRNLEKLGGLSHRMKVTSVLFFVGVLSIVAIPPFNGFVSEWLIFQSLLLSFSLNDVLVNLLVATALGMLALTGALAATCFVRFYGMAFLARPRSREAAEAKEVPRSMLLGMAVLAALCLLTGLLSTYIIPTVDQVTAPLVGTSIAGRLAGGLVLQTPVSSFSSMSPILISIVLLVALPSIYLIATRYGGRRSERVGDTWDCGTPLSERNEYTPTGFTQPLKRVFNGFYHSKTSTSIETGSDPYLRKLSFETSIPEVFEDYLYRPIAKIVTGLARKGGVIQTGSIQAYLAYIFVILLILLVIFR
jgi:hydrogenase-4 component B